MTLMLLLLHATAVFICSACSKPYCLWCMLPCDCRSPRSMGRQRYLPEPFCCVRSWQWCYVF